MNQRHDSIRRGQQPGTPLMEFGDPAGQGRGRGHGGREQHKLEGLVNRRGRGRAERQPQQNERLFPYVTSIRILYVMRLIHDDARHTGQGDRRGQTDTLRGAALLVEQVVQDLRGHHHDGRIRTHLDIACQDSDGRMRKELLEIVIFLIGKRFDGSRVEDALPLCQGTGYQILPHKGLAGTGLGADKDVISSMDTENSMFLEGIEFVLRDDSEGFGWRPLACVGGGHRIRSDKQGHGCNGIRCNEKRIHVDFILLV